MQEQKVEEKTSESVVTTITRSFRGDNTDTMHQIEPFLARLDFSRCSSRSPFTVKTSNLAIIFNHNNAGTES